MSTNVSKRIANNLLKIRLYLELSQGAFGHPLHCDQQTVSRYERGFSTAPHDYLLDVSTTYHVSLDAIYSKNIDMNDFCILSKDEYEYRSWLYPEFDNSPQHRERLSQLSKRRIYGYYINSDPRKNNIKLLEFTLREVHPSGYLDGYATVNPKMMFRVKITIPQGRYAYVFLDSLTDKRERGMIIMFYNAAGSKEYCGGLGLLLSLSTGQTPSPCAQRIILSTRKITDEGFLKNHLSGPSSAPHAKTLLSSIEDHSVYQYLSNQALTNQSIRSK